jgi:hypothetical protein
MRLRSPHFDPAAPRRRRQPAWLAPACAIVMISLLAYTIGTMTAPDDPPPEPAPRAVLDSRIDSAAVLLGSAASIGPDGVAILGTVGSESMSERQETVVAELLQRPVNNLTTIDDTQPLVNDVRLVINAAYIDGTLDLEVATMLSAIAQFSTSRQLAVTVRGYGFVGESAEANRVTSAARASSIAAVLFDNNLAREAVRVVGAGDDDPSTSADDDAEPTERVEIIIHRALT